VKFKGFGDSNAYLDREKTPPSIDAAIQLAKKWRRLFVTKGGNTGLGPANEIFFR